jgi:hypothetical protein
MADLLQVSELALEVDDAFDEWGTVGGELAGDREVLF